MAVGTDTPDKTRAALSRARAEAAEQGNDEAVRDIDKRLGVVEPTTPVAVAPTDAKPARSRRQFTREGA